MHDASSATPNKAVLLSSRKHQCKQLRVTARSRSRVLRGERKSDHAQRSSQQGYGNGPVLLDMCREIAPLGFLRQVNSNSGFPSIIFQWGHGL
jgi:hypothetical protein